MWQIFTTSLVQKAAPLALLSALAAANPTTGVESYMPYQQIHSTIQAQNAPKEAQKMASAVAKIEIENKREEAKKPRPKDDQPLAEVVKAVAYEQYTPPSHTPAPTPIPTPAPTPQPQPQNINFHELFIRYASEYGADPSIMISIAQCESGMRANAVNGPYGGMFQFLATTWSSNRNAMGLDPNPALRFNAEEAIKTAAFKMGRDGYGAWPACSKKAFASLAQAQ